MASNKIVAVHITHDNIRLVEGRVSDGVILVTHTAVVKKASRFFHDNRLVYLSDMVLAIVDAMTINSFTAKDLHIVYDNNLVVDFYLDEKLIPKKESKLSFGKKANTEGEDAAAKQEKSGGQIHHRKAWGKFITENEKGEMYTTTTIERDLVDFIISEFREHGYSVKSIEAPETALLYMRHMVPFSYDALNKLVVYANDESTGYFYQFTKDMPSGQKQFHFDSAQASGFPAKAIECIKEELRKSSLHNPYIMLIGDAFKNPNEYIEICQGLKEEGLFCIDTYGLWQDRGAPINSVRVVAPDEDVDLGLNGRFGICMCLLVRTMESKPENMVEGFHFTFLSKKSKAILAELVSTAAVFFLLYNLVFTCIGLYENHVAETEYTKASTATESMLTMAESERDALKAKVENLSTIDPRYNEIFKFVYAQVNENLNIASVDTADLIPTSGSSGSNYTQPTPQTDTTQAATDGQTGDGTATGEQQTDANGNVVDVTAQPTYQQYVWQTIVIRGYSRTTSGPVNLYKALVSAGMGEVKIIGVEQVPLPNNETLFAFELTIGTNQG